MPQFEYQVHRSQADGCQAPGIKCSSYDAEGTMTANSIYAVREFCINLMTIPGVYRVSIRNTAPECEWKEFGPIDTRNPDAAAEAVAKAKKKAKRTKKEWTITFTDVGRDKKSWTSTFTGEATHNKLEKIVRSNAAIGSRSMEFSYDAATGWGTIWVGGIRNIGSFFIQATKATLSPK